jgi:NodT family efflux transporter outer membrane factor (OMF) lipoprotein
MMYTVYLRPSIAAVTLILSACATTVATESVSPIAVPDKYQTEFLQERAATEALGVTNWWERYGSNELNTLVRRAIANNPDLKIANSQVNQAKIRAQQTGAARLPTVSMPVRAATGAGGGGESVQNSQAGLQATYRVDLWGELSAQSQTSEQLVLRALYERDNVNRNLTAAVVSTYISYLVTRDSIELARHNETIAKEMLQLTEQRVAVGDATLEDREQSRTALYTVQATLPSLESQLSDLKASISRLLGVLPREIELRGDSIDQLDSPSFSTGIPSNLLLNRPDIRAVEARMRAANANINVARARLLPPVDLSLQGGYNGLGLADLLQPQNLFWNGVASLALTIFDGGRREADTALAKAAYEDMVITYGQTVYQAIREVESALASQRASTLRWEAQNRVVRSALAMLSNTTEAYTVGAADLSAALDARRAYQRSADESKRAKAETLSAFAKLSLALGAGSLVSIEH